MNGRNILLLCGGTSSEYEVSLKSSEYIEDSLAEYDDLNVIKIIIGKDNIWRDKSGNEVELTKDKKIGNNEIHFAIPCIHGHPGETGDIQILFEMIGLPYMGSGPEASKNCFNKVTTKLWLSALRIPNTPYTFLSSMDEINIAMEALHSWKTVFVKASSQGSSVGSYWTRNEKELEENLQKAFQYSPWVLVEKTMEGREVEVSTYDINGTLHVTKPGEIVCPSKFYTYEEKYNSQSETKTHTVAPDIPLDKINEMKKYAMMAWRGMKIRHLSRIDFFYTDEGDVYLNEINTFPGMTPISMFPKMMINNGHSFPEFLYQVIMKESF